jgi:type II secretory pathway component PulF
MGRGKQHTAEQIVNLLRQVEVGVANGKSLAQACKELKAIRPDPSVTCPLSSGRYEKVIAATREYDKRGFYPLEELCS